MNLFIIFVFTNGVTNYFLVFKGHVVTLERTHLAALYSSLKATTCVYRAFVLAVAGQEARELLQARVLILATQIPNWANSRSIHVREAKGCQDTPLWLSSR